MTRIALSRAAETPTVILAAVFPAPRPSARVRVTSRKVGAVAGPLFCVDGTGGKATDLI